MHKTSALGILGTPLTSQRGARRLFLFVLVLAFTVSINALPVQNRKARKGDPNGPVKLDSLIAIPGNPLVTSDIVWVDLGTKRFYFADRSNFGIDIIDAENNLFVGRITGFAGPQTSRGDPYANATTAPPNGEGREDIKPGELSCQWRGIRSSATLIGVLRRSRDHECRRWKDHFHY
jgi:hypothetical protein